MSEIPDPSKITPKPIQEQNPINEEKKRELPSKQFLQMHMTESEYNDFLKTYVKMILDDIKKGEKRMIKATKKIANPDD